MPHDQSPTISDPSATTSPISPIGPIGPIGPAGDGAALLRQVLDELASRAVVHVSTNARGRAQFDFRLPYATIEDATRHVSADISQLIQQLRAALIASSLRLAGDDESEGHQGRTGSAEARDQSQRTAQG